MCRSAIIHILDNPVAVDVIFKMLMSMRRTSWCTVGCGNDHYFTVFLECLISSQEQPSFILVILTSKRCSVISSTVLPLVSGRCRYWKSQKRLQETAKYVDGCIGVCEVKNMTNVQSLYVIKYIASVLTFHNNTVPGIPLCLLIKSISHFLTKYNPENQRQY